MTDRVHPGLVWMALHFAEAKVNWLTHDVGDPLIGTPEYKVPAVFCASEPFPAEISIFDFRPAAAAAALEPVLRVDAGAAARLRAPPEGAVATTDHQTGGRGRLGRTWIEAPDGTAPARLRAPAAARRSGAPEFYLVAAVAVALAVERPGLAAQIKWPNDVMLARRKVAGILAEMRDQEVVVGIGVNVNQTREQLPPDARTTAGSLRTVTGREHDRSALLCESLLSRAGRRLCGLAGRRPRGGLRRARLARLPARPPGHHDGEEGVAGQMIDREGRLVLGLPRSESRR